MKLFKKVLCMLLLAGLVTGCSDSGSFDVEEVLAKVGESMDEQTSSEMELKMVMDLGVSMEGMSIDVLMTVDGVTQQVYGDTAGVAETSYIEMDITAELMGQETTETMESYTTFVDGELVTYANDGYGWYVSYSDASELTGLLSSTSSIYEAVEAFNPTAAGKKEINGVESYVIELVMTEENIGDVSEEIEGFEDIKDMLSGVELPMELYVSTEDYTITGMYMDMEPFASSLLGSMMGLQEDLEGVEINVGEFYIEVAATSYGEHDDLVVPQEVLDEVGGSSSTSGETEYSYEEVEGDVSTQTDLWTDYTITTSLGDIVANETTLAEVFAMGFVDYFEEVTADTTEESSVSSFFTSENAEFYGSTNYEESGETQELVFDYLSLDYDSGNATIAGGIGYGSSIDEVIAAYGEPNYYHIWNDGEVELYYESDDALLEISAYDDVVEDITLYTYSY